MVSILLTITEEYPGGVKPDSQTLLAGLAGSMSRGQYAGTRSLTSCSNTDSDCCVYIIHAELLEL